MSFNLNPLKKIISSSQIDPPNEFPIENPALFSQYLQKKLPQNTILIEEILSIFHLIFEENQAERGISMDELINQLEMDVSVKNIMNSPEKGVVSSELPEFESNKKVSVKNFKEFSMRECAGFLLIAFGLLSDFQEMAGFISKEFPDFLGEFLESRKDVNASQSSIFIYKGLLEFYKQFEEEIYGKMIKFFKEKPVCKILKQFFYREIHFTKKVSEEMFVVFLSNYEEFDQFLRYNSKRIQNENSVFQRISKEIIQESPKRRHVNEQKIFAVFSIKCFENKWNSLFKLFSKYKPNLIDNMNLFSAALEHKNMFHLKKFLKFNENSKEFLLDEENFARLLDFFDNEETFLNGIFLLDQIKDKELNIFYQRVLIEKFLSLLSSTSKSLISLYEILISNANPFGLCVFFSHIFLEMAQKSLELRLKFNYLAVNFRDLAANLLEKLQNSIGIKPLLTKIFYPADISVLSILLKAKDFFEIILINPNIYSIINEIWDSPYEKSNNIFNLSTNYCLFTGRLPLSLEGDMNSSFNNNSMDKLLYMGSLNNSPTKQQARSSRSMSSFLTESYTESKMNFFAYINQAESLSKTTNYVFQLKVFTKCMSFRYFLEFLSFFVGFSIILSILIQYLSMIKALNETNHTTINSVFEFLLTLDVKGTSQELINRLVSLFPIHEQTAFLSFLKAENYNFVDLNFLCHTAFYVHNKKVEAIESENIEGCFLIYEKLHIFNRDRISNVFQESILFFTCISSSLQILFYIFKNKRFAMNLGQLMDILIFLFTVALIYYNSINDNKYLMDNFENILHKMRIILTALILLIFVKAINFLRITSYLGIHLRIIFKMVSSLSTIIIMFLIIFLSFSIFMYFLFTSKDIHYETLFKSIKTLFKFIFGEMIFYYGHDEQVDYTYFAFLSIGLIFIRVIFLNIVIATLSNVYESIQKRSGLEISLMTHEYYAFQNPKEKTMNSLVLLPDPFNIISFVLSPLIIAKRSIKLNNIVLKIGFIWILIALALFFLIIHAFIIPLACLKILSNIIFNNYGEDHEVFTMTTRIAHFLQWFLFGLFYQVYVLFRYDIPHFFRKAFAVLHIPSKLDQFSLKEYQNLKRIVRIYQDVLMEKKVEIESFRKNFRKIYEVLRVYEEINWNSNENSKKNEEIMLLMKNNFDNLLVEKEIKVEVIEKLLKNIKLLKQMKSNGSKVKYPHFIDLVNLQETGDTIKLYQYKNQLLK